MAYQKSTVTTITDIPAIVATFAAANGWTVSGTNFKYGSGVEFALTATISGFNHELAWTKTTDSRVTSAAKIRSPKLNGTTAAPAVSIPAAVHLFANTSPQPFLAIVVEYAFNSYRHLYLGYLEKLGAFSGGEVISGTQFFNTSNALVYPVSYRDDATGYLFTSRNRSFDAANQGGVLVDHASNPTKWRTFYGPTGISTINSFTGSEALGGFKDDINDAYIARGRSTYAGVNLLVPIQLYVPKGSGSSAQFVPVGNPAGIRSINMNDIDPATSITIGSDQWMCFPAISKGADTVGVLGGGWGLAETSGMVGYAYRKN